MQSILHEVPAPKFQKNGLAYCPLCHAGLIPCQDQEDELAYECDECGYEWIE